MQSASCCMGLIHCKLYVRLLAKAMRCGDKHDAYCGQKHEAFTILCLLKCSRIFWKNKQKKVSYLGSKCPVVVFFNPYLLFNTKVTVLL